MIKIFGLLPDKPGILKDVLTIVANIRANLVAIEHDKADPQISPGKAKVTLTLEVSEVQYLEELKKKLESAGYHFT